MGAIGVVAVNTWFVYLLRCADGTLYCGVTTDIQRRLSEHNGLKPGGAKYTRARRPVHLCTYAACEGRSSAQKLEDVVRKLPRNKKITALQGYAKANELAS